jgi:hypothetical protein
MGSEAFETRLERDRGLFALAARETSDPKEGLGKFSS